jgi:hypothetical protein
MLTSGRMQGAAQLERMRDWAVGCGSDEIPVSKVRGRKGSKGATQVGACSLCGCSVVDRQILSEPDASFQSNCPARLGLARRKN